MHSNHLDYFTHPLTPALSLFPASCGKWEREEENIEAL